MANIYCSSVAWTAVTAWAASTAYAVGAIRRQLATPAVNNERCFRCTTAGTSGSAEPSWGLSAGAVTSDGTGALKWTEITGLEAYQAPGAWAAPFARVSPMTDRMNGGDTGYLSSDHSETQSAGITLNCGNGSNNTPLLCVSVNRASGSHVPPQAGDYAIGATVFCNGNMNLAQSGNCSVVFMGITFSCNGPSDGNNISLSGGTGSEARFIDCTIKLNGNGTNIQSQSSSAVYALNSSFIFASTGQRINHFGYWKLRGCKFAPTGTVPQYLFSSLYAGGSTLDLEDCDLSTISGSGVAIFNESYGVAKITMKNCKLAAGVQITPANINQVDIYVVRCGATASLAGEFKYNQLGAHIIELTAVRTGGRSDGTTASSWNVTTQASASWLRPFETMQMLVWNASVGSQVTATVEGIWVAPTAPNNDDIWGEVEYFGSSASPIGSTASNTKTDRLATGTALTASTAAWDSLAPARANSTSYTTGAVIKLASNAGRLFFCTSGGQSAASEPAGYASAVDGGTVVDNGATFQAGVRFKIQVPFTPALVGPVGVTIRVARPSAAFYIDPIATVA